MSTHRVCLAIAGLTIELSGPPIMLASTRARYQAFVTDEPVAAMRLQIHRAGQGFSDHVDRGEGVEVRPHGDGWALSGRLCGAVDAHGGWLAEAHDLGAVDALVRLALVRRLPSLGALPFHAALTDDGTVFAGHSGAGKSTVAAALGGLCDELTVVGDEGRSAWSTPYWGQRSLAMPLRRVVILQPARDGEVPVLTRLNGMEALRALVPHLVRWAPLPSVDGPSLRLLGRLCEQVEVVRAVCPRGDAFVPFVAQALAVVPAVVSELVSALVSA